MSAVLTWLILIVKLQTGLLNLSNVPCFKISTHFHEQQDILQFTKQSSSTEMCINHDQVHEPFRNHCQGKINHVYGVIWHSLFGLSHMWAKASWEAEWKIINQRMQWLHPFVRAHPPYATVAHEYSPWCMQLTYKSTTRIYYSLTNVAVSPKYLCNSIVCIRRNKRMRDSWDIKAGIVSFRNYLHAEAWIQRLCRKQFKRNAEADQ